MRLPGADWAERLLAAQDAPALPPPPGGRLLRVVPLGRFDGRPAPPLGQLLGAGLDARLFTDVSGLTPETLVTPTDQFFVRTAASTAHAARGSSRIRVNGPRPFDLTPADLAARSTPAGTHVMECSGNSDPANFGLISAARWSGVPISTLLEQAGAASARSLVRVAGFDDERQRTQTSVPGASWLFSRDDLERAGAFLATGMNDGPLPLDHGFPARLVVPGWYGCVCIKWVTSIDVVGPDERPTAQMQEFGERTHQVGPGGAPTRARDYQPAVMDLAAMPVRVEQWQVGDARLYRVVGVRWGGETRTRALTIRFRHDERYVRVEQALEPPSTTMWALWAHTWRPASPGRYQITLGVADPTIRTRRLDLFFYVREIEVDEI
jgi:DMSO/TMAO reductase YedYZ molybdopterin-dependent catalytic subunit